MIFEKTGTFLYGGDYNPDQWSEELWEEDIRQMKVHNVNVVTLPVFSWANLQPSEDSYNFEWLDRVLDLLAKNNIYAVMATPTAAQPAWMSKKYPDVLPVSKDGMKRKHGARNNFCANSPSYRRFSRNIAEKMAERYANHPALLLWHINNEYGTSCYCENCSIAFRKWLQNKYKTIQELNRRWYTNFWGHTYYDWDEIEVPSYLNEECQNGLGNRDASFLQSMSVDYHRFMSQSILDCYKNEVEGVKKYTPNVPVTTNVMSTFKTIDLHQWGPHLEIMAWDNYPSNDDLHSEDLMSIMALRHGVVRGTKDNQPFILMEQTPSQQNWLPFNMQKRPGQMRLWSYQTVAHGADGIMFFQWRQSKCGFEKYHAAMVPHVGHENTRMGRELAQLGQELKQIGADIMGSRVESKVAIIFDWPNYWAAEYSSGPSVSLNYKQQVIKYYKAFHKMNISVDVIPQNADFSKYDIILAPVLCMVRDGFDYRIKSFVKNGGTFVTTYFSGLVDEDDQVILGGYPGAFRDLLGIWVEETDAISPQMSNEIIMASEGAHLNGIYKCGNLCDVVHLEGAKALANYGQDYYAGTPCITENQYGKGKAYYIAAEPEDKFVSGLAKMCSETHGIRPFADVPPGVEIMQRKKDSKIFTFVLNSNQQAVMIDLPEGKYINKLSNEALNGRVEVNSMDVMILEQ